MRCLLLALASAAALATGPAPALQAQEPGRIQLDTFTLGNGLKVVLAPDHSTQVVAVNVWYNVGSRNEVAGRTGFAHLFEHMMFQGSANVPKGGHMSMVEQAGGSMNGTTANDRTNYFEVLPSNRYNLGLWLEADRMKSLAVTQANLENQRETVKEERRMRVDNQPYTGSLLKGVTAPFDPQSCFAYGHETIGSMTDLNAASVADVQAFFKQYYAPNNATLTLVGDFDPAEARRLIQQYFGDIPRVDTPPAVSCDVKFNAGEKRETITDAKATLPALLRVYLVPGYSDKDHAALELLSTVLGSGESSRMNRAIVRDAKAALAAQAGLDVTGPHRGPSVFIAFAIANQGVNPDSLDKLITQQVEMVASQGISDAELTKAKNSRRASLIFEKERALSTAEAIQNASMFLGDPYAVNTDLDRYMSVTKDDIRRVAQQYLRRDNSTVILIKTPEGPRP
ncbi:MAG: putative zinc protease [Gemmatimonadetes bacterium]|jgi:zinc protease|nr:putative zinc protease [Gemmatimonadota bacterium]